MKNKLFFLSFAVFLIFSNALFSQQICNTPSKTANSFINKSAFMRSTNNNNTYCLKVYFHVVRQSNGIGGQSVGAVNQGFQILNQDFNPHNISFKWDNTIDYINNTTIYNNPNFGLTQDSNGNIITPPTIFTINNHQDGIDIYLFDDSVNYGGLANGVGGSSEFYVSGSFWESPYQSLITSHVISHEMGHVIFLWHTHHGIEDSNDNPCPELVNGSNSSTCGDYVTDTPADPYIGFNVNSSCQWLGNGTDANGQTYNPDELNIMAYTTPQCMSYFTPLQGFRMRNAIATLPYLTQTVVSNCLSCETASTLDLYVKDGQTDTGIEPNTTTQYMWNSDNIWVRNNNDGGLTHENPDYSANGNPNYIKVRVINKSCVTSTGNEKLKLYWAKASTGLSWPNPWNGGILEPVTNASMGQLIGTLNIPTLMAGQETILTFPWQVPNPADYSQDQWHFCLLARVDAINDPMTVAETGDINLNTLNNNNIAWKNVTVVDILPNNIANPGGVVAVANPFNHPKTFFLELEIADLETGKPIYQEAEVGIKMNDVLYQAWERGGKEAQLLDSTLEEKRKIVRGNHVILDNIAFNANESGTLRLDFNFLTKELTDKTNYAYYVIQKDADTGQVIGGETFIINKNPRTKFEAEADDKEVDLNQAITINAEDINEPAIYNWYDSAGNLIYQGKDLQIANAISEKFKLEVISAVDGFKDYTEIEVKLKPSTLENIVPNPATNNVLVSYKLNGVNSAYLMVIGYYGSNGTSNNYILAANSNETNLNVSNYQSRFYTVALVVNGEIVDAKTLIKQ